ncbi:MAG: YciK family oxidoreductase [Gammaproteobacteria bacterium]|nr:YciK family oxidoreductase [Gammaproteobacteria bacterium]MCP5299299.1 YciK family oxidoreductase [Chromatiaceae bacterium]
MHADYKPADDLLDDRIILVTGAGDGIGRAAARAFAAHGATVVLLGRTVPKLERVYDEIEAAGGPEPAIYPMHLEGASPHDYEELAHVIDMNFDRLDGILHNAANLPYLSRIKDYEADDWMKVVQVNLNAPFLLTQACLPLLSRSEDASVLFTTDVVGRVGKAFWGAYAASKFAIEGFSQVLAAELENSAVRVNCVDPGPTLTALRKRAFPGEENTQLKPPETPMPLYLWAMGPDSRGTTGQRLAWDT